MPNGIAMSTDPAVTNSVPHNMGSKLNSPLVGCQSGSLKNRDKPIVCRMGKVSRIKNSTINRTIAAAKTAIPRNIQTRIASLRDWDKILLLHYVLHLRRTGKINKVFLQPCWSCFCNQVEGT